MATNPTRDNTSIGMRPHFLRNMRRHVTRNSHRDNHDCINESPITVLANPVNNTVPVANSADTDQDVIGNQLRQALGVLPGTPSVLPAPQQVNIADENHLGLIFIRPSGRNDVILTGEVADCLALPWLSGGDAVGMTTTDKGNGTETVTLWDNSVFGISPKRFLHIKSTEP